MVNISRLVTCVNGTCIFLTGSVTLVAGFVSPLALGG
jgi:hypothetical protein